MKHRNKILWIVGSLLIVLLAVTNVTGYELICLEDGQTIEFSLCNPRMSDKTCDSSGFCSYCTFIGSSGAHCPAETARCNAIGATCTFLDDDTPMDLIDPVITLNEPFQDEVYGNKNVQIDISVSEATDIYYAEFPNTRDRWSRLCSNCAGYTGQKSFKEGANEIIFKAEDRSGNEGFYNVEFYVDSKAPEIKSTLPKDDFASGHFEIQFNEENPISLILYYGTSGNMRQQSIDLATCIPDRSTICTTDVNLADFDGQEIEYYAELTDLAGSMDSSNPITLDVDYSSPIIQSLDKEINGKKVTFTIEIDEPYLDEVTYIDHNVRRPRERKLCTKLVEGFCIKKVNFKDGEHNVTIKVIDEAGNTASQSTQFFTDSKDPKISRLYPRRGFATGDFEIQFKEENPVLLELFYGNEDLGITSRVLSIEAECHKERSKQVCLTSADMTPYDGQEIEFWFELTDRVGQMDISRPVELDVDTTFPIINLINYTIDRNRALILLDVTELNFDEALYANNADSRPRQRRLCSRLRDNQCTKNINLDEGSNQIDIQVIDEAGNSVAESIEIIL